MRTDSRVPKHIKKALDETGLPWEMERKKKHQFIRICGEVVIAIPQYGYKEVGRHIQNNIATIKRAARRLKEK